MGVPTIYSTGPQIIDYIPSAWMRASVASKLNYSYSLHYGCTLGPNLLALFYIPIEFGVKYE